MNKYNEVLQGLDKLNIKYQALGDMLGEHAFLKMDNNYYHIEIVDHNNIVEVYAYYVKSGEEKTYFKKDYKQLTSALKKVVELYKELNE